jgi:RNA polymerase sigma-70 factor (ECF subfamily)
MGIDFNQDTVINDVVNGDKSSFGKLFKLYYPRLNRYALYFLNDSGEAEDLVQDVFFQIWENRATLNSKKNFASFIYTLVKNRCLNSIKRKVVEEKFVVNQVKLESEELYHISFEVEGGFTSMEEMLLNEIEKIMEEMPERCKIAFRLKWIEEKKIREIAEIMNISTTMVDKHLAKGLQIAREKLSPELFLFLCLFRG